MVRDHFRNDRRADEKSTFAAIALSRECGVHLDIREPLTATMLPICWQGAGPSARDKPRWSRRVTSFVHRDVPFSRTLSAGTHIGDLVYHVLWPRTCARLKNARPGPHIVRYYVSRTFPVVYLARHGETAWTVTGQHTGLTDLPLTEHGECNARKLGERLNAMTFAAVLTSPLRRAMRTCELAGFGPVAEIDPDLVEWDYGEYEGRRTADILAERPEWQLFRDGCPGGESPEHVATRADRVVHRVRRVAGDVLLFSSGHFLRVLAARWIGMEAIVGGSFMLSTASLSGLSHEHSVDQPAIHLWNDN